jgi:hypothetical protein
MKTIMSRVVAAVISVLAVGCSGGGTPATGQSCKVASDCYKGLTDASGLHGEVMCLSLQNGYCSHTCTQDTDCCAVSGECPAGIREVCAPLESNMQTYCFVSCDDADLPTSADGGKEDSTAYCHRIAGSSFTCRSTGGGAANKKFCGP